MLTKNEKDLIAAVAEAGLGEDMMSCAISGIEDSDMPIFVEYIKNRLREGKKVTSKHIIRTKLILADAMPYVWDYADYIGKIRITTRDDKVYIGTILGVKDCDDDEEALDDSFILNISGKKKEIFAHEVLGIEPLG